MTYSPRLDRPNLLDRCTAGSYTLELYAGDSFARVMKMLFIMGVSCQQLLDLNWARMHWKCICLPLPRPDVEKFAVEPGTVSETPGPCPPAGTFCYLVRGDDTPELYMQLFSVDAAAVLKWCWPTLLREGYVCIPSYCITEPIH